MSRTGFLTAYSLEQFEVLHAGTHLDEVYVLEEGRCSVFMISVTMGEPVARQASEQVETLAAHPLEGVGGSAGLERTAAQQGSTGCLDALGAIGDLLSLSMLQGPAMTAKLPPPIFTPSTSMTLSSGWNLRLAFL